MTAFGPSENYVNSTSIYGGIAIWNRDLSRLDRWLLTESNPLVISTTSLLVFAGCSDGSLAGWDLRENSRTKKVLYSSFLVNGAIRNSTQYNISAITKLHVFKRNEESKLDNLELVSCDDAGRCVFWVSFTKILFR
jgi:hypothetical protein